MIGHIPVFWGFIRYCTKIVRDTVAAWVADSRLEM
jgi:hypothetical protein